MSVMPPNKMILDNMHFLDTLYTPIESEDLAVVAASQHCPQFHPMAFVFVPSEACPYSHSKSDSMPSSEVKPSHVPALQGPYPSAL